MSNSEAESAAILNANEAYASAREYVEAIDEAVMAQPNRVGIWSGKDLVFHIADWEAQGARILTDIASGQPEVWIPDGVDGNTFNEQRVAEHADLTLDEALDYWERAHNQLVEAFANSDGDREDILNGLTRRHYHGHLPDFRHVKPFKPLSQTEREELVARMDAANTSFLDALETIDEAQLERENTVGIWSGKDLIAHLGHWQQAAIDLTVELEQDRPGKWPGEDGNNINEWNEVRVEATRVDNLATIRANQQQRYEELRTLMLSSPYATRAAGVGSTEFHYELHKEDFERLR